MKNHTKKNDLVYNENAGGNMDEFLKETLHIYNKIKKEKEKAERMTREVNEMLSNNLHMEDFNGISRIDLKESFKVVEKNIRKFEFYLRKTKPFLIENGMIEEESTQEIIDQLKGKI